MVHFQQETSDGSQNRGSRKIGPGKTSPRLLYDAVLLDPGASTTTINILSHPAPVFDSNQRRTKLVPDDACAHDYVTHVPECRFPPMDKRAISSDRNIITVLCRKCRLYMVLQTEQSQNSHNPCPNVNYPLHHFSLVQNNAGMQRYVFVCTSVDCSTYLTIQYQNSTISIHDIELLTNTERLRQRYETAITKEAGRAGFVYPTPVATLWKLRRYIQDSITTAADGSRKRIPVENKRFLESFGEHDCDELFARLGFESREESDIVSWLLPSAEPGSDLRMTLDRWDIELQALIDKFVASDGDLNPCPEYIWHLARHDMERLLSAQSYTKSFQQYKDDSKSAQDHPHYASLGAMREFSDDLIVFAFDRQCDCDPLTSPYYFDCLRGIAQGRQSDTLNTRVAIAASQGICGRQEIAEAYRCLRMSPDMPGTDEELINAYRSLAPDTGPQHQAQLRSMLERLGHARQSPALLAIASDTIETYSQALSWFGAEENFADDSIITLYTAKVADSSSNEHLARRAVHIIAEYRKSDLLKGWLSTGVVQETGMSIEDACRHLNIQLSSVDDQMLQLVFDNARKDNPGWKTDKAIEAVTLAYQRPEPRVTQDPSTWPVGLISHGNTCYLNSLLQYYFTIKPLRDIVLNFDSYKFDLSAATMKHERVGGRRVTPLEIRAYQKFVDDVRNLFEHMITDQGPSVKPEADLVCRAFLKAEDVETQSAIPTPAPSPPRRSSVDTDKPLPSLPSEVSNASSTTLHSAASSATLAHHDIDMIAPPSTPPLASKSGSTVGQRTPALPPRSTEKLGTPARQQTSLSKAEEAARQQQDVTEVMDEILFRFRCAIKSNGMDTREEQLDSFRDIFYMCVSEKTLGEDGSITSRDDYHLNILLNIPTRPTDIYTALDEIFELQTIEYGEKRVKQFRTLKTLPPIFQVNIPRITYDRKSNRQVKLDHKLHLEEYLYLDKYYEWDNSDIMDKRRATWASRQQLDVLQAQKDVIEKNDMGMNGPTVLQTAAKYLKNLHSSNETLTSLNIARIDIDDSVAGDLDAIAAAQKAQLATLDAQIKSLQQQIGNPFATHQQIRYRLHAVFFHRGSHGHGHYWSCIHDNAQKMWRTYNDEKVDELKNVNDIYDAETWQQGTPTYAVYVKDDASDTFVQTVCRNLPSTTTARQSQAQPQDHKVDEVMQDAPHELDGRPIVRN